MRAGIIAAGLGERLRDAFPDSPKPLVPVGGKPLVHWLARSLRKAGVREATILLNSRGNDVRTYLESEFEDIDWTFLQRDTASSWESFRLVCLELAKTSELFLISTVDALIPAREIIRFLAAARASRCEAALALTRFVQDEKPLWADLDDAGRVRAVGGGALGREHVTCGLYAMTRRSADGMPPAEAHDKLRGYWESLVRGGSSVAGVLLSKTVDVDRPEDVATAEAFLSEVIS